jgi:hypothetical protein
MWVVTVRASHLARREGVRRDPMDLRALRFVTSEAGLLLCHSVHDTVPGGVDQVAGRAGDVTPLMLAACPMLALPAPVTCNARFHLLARLLGAMDEEVNIDLRAGRGALGIPDVIQARSMTGLAAGCALVGLDAVWCFIDREYRACLCLVVTTCADAISLDAAIGRCA